MRRQLFAALLVAGCGGGSAPVEQATTATSAAASTSTGDASTTGPRVRGTTNLGTTASEASSDSSSETGSGACPQVTNPSSCDEDCLVWGEEVDRLEVAMDPGEPGFVDVAAHGQRVAMAVRHPTHTRVSLLDTDLAELWSVELFDTIEGGFPSVSFDADGGVLVSATVAANGPAQLVRLDGQGAVTWETTAPGRISRMYAVPGGDIWATSSSAGMDSGELFRIRPGDSVEGPLQAGPDAAPYLRTYRWVSGDADALVVVGADTGSRGGVETGWVEGTSAKGDFGLALDAFVAAPGDCQTLHVAYGTDGWPELAQITHGGATVWSQPLLGAVEPVWIARDAGEIWVAAVGVGAISVARFGLAGDREHVPVVASSGDELSMSVRLALLPGGDLYVAALVDEGQTVALRRLSR